jgi:plastocyanin
MLREEAEPMKSSAPSLPTATIWRSRLAGVAALIVLATPASLIAAEPPSLPPPSQIAQGAASQVSIDNFQFSPATLTVPTGTTVTWTNRDDMVHTVTSTTRVFSSSSLETDATFSYTFTSPGTYSYFCALHPRMTATVIVK